MQAIALFISRARTIPLISEPHAKFGVADLQEAAGPGEQLLQALVGVRPHAVTSAIIRESSASAITCSRGTLLSWRASSNGSPNTGEIYA